MDENQMDENQILPKTQNPKPKNEYSDDEIDLMEYVRTIWRYRNFICIVVGATFFISIIISLILPKQYKATALISAGTIGRDEAGKYVSMLKGMAGGFFNIGSLSTSNMQILGLLKSRSLADHLIESFNLTKEREVEKRDNLRTSVLGMLQVKETKEDFIELSVEQTDPKKSAAYVNEAVKYVDQLINNLNINGVSRQRVFLENRLKEVKVSLDHSEETIKQFQEKFKLVDIETQTASTVSSLGMINSQLIEAETELGVKIQSKSQRDPDLLNLKAKIAELRKQQERIAVNSPDMSDTEGSRKNSAGYLISLEKAPEISLEFIRLKRNLKIQETLYELLIESYELAKIDETKNLPKITIIDKATIPDVKSRPNRKFIVVISTFLSFFIAVTMVLVFEHFVKEKLGDRFSLKQWRSF